MGQNQQILLQIFLDRELSASSMHLSKFARSLEWNLQSPLWPTKLWSESHHLVQQHTNGPGHKSFQLFLLPSEAFEDPSLFTLGCHLACSEASIGQGANDNTEPLAMPEKLKNPSLFVYGFPFIFSPPYSVIKEMSWWMV